MTFEPERCGSSLASTDTGGDAADAKPIDGAPATSSRSPTAGQITPANVKSEQAALLGFVRAYLSFLRPTSLNRMIKAIEKPQN
jgi:hypothetical protein